MVAFRTLGHVVKYKNQYDVSLLDPISRQLNRTDIGVDSDNLPFYGCDILNIYELSWLDKNGKPNVAMGEITIPANSANIIETKSLKLYFNSFNNSVFSLANEVEKIITRDLSKAANAAVKFSIISLDNVVEIFKPQGISIDNIECTPNFDFVNPKYITVEPEQVSEHLYSNLLKSNCLVTGQPDWATIEIIYSGKKINHKSLLEYILSFRNHQEFHEHCIERIFVDIMHYAKPSLLTVFARYTRRGGLDINPFRTSDIKFIPTNNRYVRQ